MACPNFKNGPKTELRPLGVKEVMQWPVELLHQSHEERNRKEENNKLKKKEVLMATLEPSKRSLEMKAAMNMWIGGANACKIRARHIAKTSQFSRILQVSGTG
jgi:hypothetical protein